MELLCENKTTAKIKMLNSRRRKVRSSRPEKICKKGVLRNFTKFTGKHLRQSLFFNKNAGLSFDMYFGKMLHINMNSFLI